MLKYISLMLAIAVAGPLSAEAAQAQHVVIVSIDGLRPDVYRASEKQGLKMPHLNALVQQGVSADRVITVYPSVTYPAHTTIVTGVEPARHKVTSNFRFGTFEWLKNASDIKSPTLWQAAKKAGVTTSSIMWPMTYGADIDWLIVEADESRKENLRTALTRGSTKGLIEHLERVVAKLPAGAADSPLMVEETDKISAAYAAKILKENKPGLMLVHFLEADHMQHHFGPDSQQASRAFENIDRYIGLLLEAVKSAGIVDKTDVIVVGDHGFAPVHTVINAGKILLDTGYGKLENGIVSSDLVSFESQAGSGAFYAKPHAKPEAVAAFRQALKLKVEKNYRGLLAWMTDEDIARLGGDGGAVATLTASPGYMIAHAPGSERSLPTRQFRGMHGYTPEMALMDTGLVAAGPSFRRGDTLPVARLVDVAPTVSEILNLKLKDTDGDVMVGALHLPEQDNGVF